MQLEILDKDGSNKGNIELSKVVFGTKVNKSVIYNAVKNEMANKRQGTVNTKTRSDVRGGGAKPWRQKGTGRARQGSRRSPIWTGGGVVFGPHPRDYSYRIPKKEKQLAFRCILTYKRKNQLIKIVDDFKVDSGKTKDLASILNKLTSSKKVVLIYKDSDPMFARAIKNIPWIKSMCYKRMNMVDLYLCDEILIMKDAVTELNKFLDPEKE